MGLEAAGHYFYCRCAPHSFYLFEVFSPPSSHCCTQLLHPIVTTSALLLLSCRWTLGESRPVLRDSLVTECYTPEWCKPNSHGVPCLLTRLCCGRVRAVLGGVVVLLAFGVGFPLALLILLRRRQRVWQSSRSAMLNIYKKSRQRTSSSLHIQSIRSKQDAHDMRRAIPAFCEASAAWGQLSFLHRE